MINALISISLKSNITLQLSTGAALKAIPNSSGSYQIVAVVASTNVTILGGTIEGERGAHTGAGGEWGMGIGISGSENVVVDGVTVKECWGDGIYIGGASSKNVTLRNMIADHNRRQGLSITNADGITVRDSIFKNTDGTSPKSGIDIEPNSGQTVKDVLITGCTSQNNLGRGFLVYGGAGLPIDITFDSNRITSNSGSAGIDIYYSTRTQVLNNIIDSNNSKGIYEQNDYSSNITGNIVTGNTGYGINSITSTSSYIGANTVWLNGKETSWDTPIPTIFSGATASTESIVWNWNSVTGATGYRIVSLSGANLSGNLPSNAVNWTETGLSTNTAYTRRCVAFNALGVSTSVAVTAYTFAANDALNLAGLKAYPNPCDFKAYTLAITGIPLDEPAPGIYIYTSAGELVRALKPGDGIDRSNIASWNGRVKGGVRAASGLYIYLVKTKKYGKGSGKFFALW